MVNRVLNMCTKDSDNPDLRDRGFVYWVRDVVLQAANIDYHYH